MSDWSELTGTLFVVGLFWAASGIAPAAAWLDRTGLPALRARVRLARARVAVALYRAAIVVGGETR